MDEDRVVFSLVCPGHGGYRHTCLLRAITRPPYGPKCHRWPADSRSEFTGIGMALLQVIDRDHQRQPDFTGCRFGRATLVLKAGKVLDFKAANPHIDRRTRYLHKVTNTDLRPPLIIQFDDLEASLIAIGVVVIGAKQARLAQEWMVMPEPFDGLVVNAIIQFVPDNPGQFAIPKAVVEGVETRQFLHYRFRDPSPAWAEHLSVLGISRACPVAENGV